MEGKKISIATVAKRMNRILAAYREQRSQEVQSDGSSVVASTSSSQSSSSSAASSSGETNCMAERKMVLDKKLLNYAAKIDNESDSDSDLSDHSFSFVASPPKRRCQTSSSNTMTTNEPKSKRRRNQPVRTVKRATVKLPLMATKRVQRKVTCTITSKEASSSSSASSSDHSHDRISLNDSSELPIGNYTLNVFPDSDDSDSAVIPTKKSPLIIKTSTSKSTCIKPM